MFSYFIILIQFTPKLIMDLRDPTILQKEHLSPSVVKLLLEQIEALKY